MPWPSLPGPPFDLMPDLVFANPCPADLYMYSGLYMYMYSMGTSFSAPQAPLWMHVDHTPCNGTQSELLSTLQVHGTALQSEFRTAGMHQRPGSGTVLVLCAARMDRDGTNGKCAGHWE